jgi:acyl-CoA reductase-like NAD-dependent aldehyde dehydrogenase
MVPGATPTAQVLEVRAPFDDSLIATVATLDRAGIDLALATAHDLFADRSAWLPAARRIEILNRSAALMEQHADRLTLLAAREGGKAGLLTGVGVALIIEGLRAWARGHSGT